MSIICYDSDGNVLRKLYQWDTNQVIYVSGIDISEVPVFHFCNRVSKEALVVAPSIVGNRISVSIPNVLLQQAEPIIAYLCESDIDGSIHTTDTIQMPVDPRPKPSDYEYVDNIEYHSYEILSGKIESAIGALSNTQEEVLDIRVGHDGTKYDNAGDAVRAIGKKLAQIQDVYTIRYNEGYLWGEEGFDYAAARAAFGAGRVVMFNYTRIANAGSERYICTKDMSSDEAYSRDGLLFLGASYGNITELRLYPDGTFDINVLVDTYDLEVKQKVLEDRLNSMPISYLFGPNNNPVILRDLESGVYLIEGAIRPNSSGTKSMVNGDIFIVTRDDEYHYTYAYKFVPSIASIGRYSISDSAVTYTSYKLSDIAALATRVTNLESRLNAYGI